MIAPLVLRLLHAVMSGMFIYDRIDRVVNTRGMLRRRLARPTVRLTRASPRKIYMSHRPVACRDAMRYPTAVAVEIVYAATSDTEIMHLCIVHTCRNLLFIERMKTRPMQLYPPNISCVGFCSALATRKFISPPGYKYLEKKLLLNVDYVITLRSVDDRNAYVHRA